jgi:hypothetical protein
MQEEIYAPFIYAEKLEIMLKQKKKERITTKYSTRRNCNYEIRLG